MSLDPHLSESSICAASSSAQLFRGSFELSRVPLGNAQELVYSPLTRAACALPTASVRLIQACRAFATLDDHAARLCRDLNLGPQQAPEVRRELAALADASFLFSHDQLATLCRRQLAPPVPPVAMLGIPTRNRPSQLQLCLSSYIKHNHRHERQLEYVVVDDSDDPAVRDSQRRLLQELKAREAVSIAYAGPEERENFAAALVRHTGLPAEDVRFAILNDGGFPVATGASRNALMLHGVGEVLLQVDDDTSVQLAPAPGSQPGLALCSDYDPTQFWFLAENEPMPSVAEGAEPCVLALHEQLLGRGLGDCLAIERGLNLDRAGTSFFRRLEYGTGRVLVTAAGVMGDSGMGSPSYFLSLDEPSRSRLLRSESIYREALARQQVLRAVAQPTISDGVLCMALNLGLDHREVLPPFTPVQRNQDGVFAALLRACWPNAYFGFLPWALLHQAPSVRRMSFEAFWRVTGQVTSGQILEALVGLFSPGPNRGKPLASLRALGRSLEDWGSAPPADLEELVRLLLWTQTGRAAAQLEQRLYAAQGQPPFWAEDVRRLLASWRNSLPLKDWVIPSDLVPRFGTDAWSRFREIVRRFGRLLQIWPDLIAAAKDLRARGQRLARDI